MDVEALRQLAFKLLGKRKTHDYREKGFIYYHGQRVAKLALNLRQLIIPGDSSKDDIITVASYFHDVAKGIEPHFEYGAILIKEILKGYCNENEIEEIAQIIGSHTLRGKNKSYPPQVKIVQDADILDHYGTLEIWLNFHYYAYHNASIEEALKFYGDEYYKQLAEVRELLNYDISKEILDDKIAFQNDFIRRFAIESQGDIAFKGILTEEHHSVKA